MALVCGLFISTAALAQEVHYNQDSTWNYGGNVGLNFNQSYFSNWATGGDNAIGGNLNFDYTAKYKKDKHIWDSRTELAFGLNNTESTGTRKTNDKIYLSSTYGYEIAKNLYISGLLNFQTQFADGFDYKVDPAPLISRFMAPGYLTIGTGLTWTPKKWFTATATPAAWRGVFVLDEVLSDAGQFGVKPGNKLLSEFGMNLQLEADFDVMKNIHLYTRVILYSNYLENPQNVDLNWELKLDFKVNKWFSAFIGTTLAYDDDIMIKQDNGRVGPALQFTEVIGLGLNFAL